MLVEIIVKKLRITFAIYCKTLVISQMYIVVRITTLGSKCIIALLSAISNCFTSYKSWLALGYK